MEQKRLTRSQTNRMICGVCAGIGEYFGIDATIVRLIGIGLICFGGLGIFAYIFAAIIIPEDYTEGEAGIEHIVSLENMAIPNLDLKLDAGYFEIIESNVSDIVVKSTEEINVNKDGNTIKIHTPLKIITTKMDTRATIEIPQGMKFQDVFMNVGAGELRCQSIAADNLKIKVGAGKIIAENFDSEKSVISVGAGEITVNAGVSADMDIDVGMGSFTFHGTANGDLVANCGVGNVQMWLDGDQRDYNYHVKCAMGNITVGNNSYGGMATDQHIDNNAAYQCKLDCGMGRIAVHFEN